MLLQIYKSISEKQKITQELYIKVIQPLGEWFFSEFTSEGIGGSRYLV